MNGGRPAHLGFLWMSGPRMLRQPSAGIAVVDAGSLPLPEDQALAEDRELCGARVLPLKDADWKDLLNASRFVR